MDHVAIMKKSWGLTEKILKGEKKIESRWYQTKRIPWNTVKEWDAVYFKNSGEPVKIRARVSKILKFENLTPGKIKSILAKYGRADGMEKTRIPFFFKLFKNKKYCLLIFLKNPKAIEPFEIDKTGFGAMAAWISVNNISRIKRNNYGGN